MVDSEACRLILAHHAIAYREEAHLLCWTSVVALWRGFTPRIPLLYGDGLRLAGAYGIAQHFDKDTPPPHRLIPEDEQTARSVSEAWRRYNFSLGFSVAIFAYFHLLPQRTLMLEPLSRGLPAYERRFLERHYGFFTGILRLILRLNASRAQSARDAIRATFDDTDKLLKGGRPFLLGDRFSLADIALASATAPVLLPDGYGSLLPPLDTMPPDMKALIGELREHDTARFVRNIYETHGAGSTQRSSAPNSFPL